MVDHHEKQYIRDAFRNDPQAKMMRRVTTASMMAVAVITLPAACFTYLNNGMSTPSEIKAAASNGGGTNAYSDLTNSNHDDNSTGEAPNEPNVVSESVSFDGEKYTLTGLVVSPDGSPLSNSEVTYEFYDANGLSYGQVTATTNDEGAFTLVANKDTLTSINAVASFTCINANGLTQSQGAATIEAARTSFFGADRRRTEPVGTVENNGQYYIWYAEEINDPLLYPSDNQLGRYGDKWYIVSPGTAYYQAALKSLKPGDQVAIDDKTIQIEKIKNFPASASYDAMISEIGSNKTCFVRFRTDNGYGIAYGKEITAE